MPVQSEAFPWFASNSWTNKILLVIQFFECIRVLKTGLLREYDAQVTKRMFHENDEIIAVL